MAKLPADIDPVQVNNATYVYTDAMEMLEDLRRIRRKTGWNIVWVGKAETFAFQAVGPYHADVDKEPFAQFEIRVETVRQRFWPSLYPQDPFADRLRQWFFEKAGPHKIAAWLNETPQDPEQLPDEASVWSRLLRDDDELV